MKRILNGLMYYFMLFPLLSYLSYEYLDTLITSITFVVLFVISVLFFSLKLVKKSKLNIPIYLRFYILFFIYQTLADYISGNVSGLGYARYIYTNYYLSMLLMMVIIENYSFDTKIIRDMTAAIKFILILGTIVSIIQIEFNEFWTLERVTDNYEDRNLMFRCTSIFDYLGGGSIGVAVPSFLAILYSQSLMGRKNNMFYYILCAIMVLLYKSRWVMISFLIALSQNLKFDKKFVINSVRYLTLAVIMIVITLASSILLDIDTERYLTERLLSKSTDARVRSIEVFMIHFPKHALLGTGNVLTSEAKRDLAGRSNIIHVGFLSLFYYYGVVGGGLYCMYIITLLRKLKRESAISGFKALYFIFIMIVVANITLVKFHTFDFSIIMGFVFHNYYRDKAIAQQQLELKTA